MKDFFYSLVSVLYNILKVVFLFVIEQLQKVIGINGYLALALLVASLCLLFYIYHILKKRKNRSIELKQGSFDKDRHYSEQLHRIKMGGYKPKLLLNKTEQAARRGILQALYSEHIKSELQLYAQVSLGEIITHQNNKLYQDINSKRVDFLLVDKDFTPIAVIEIHGQGHYIGQDATQRDQIKEFVLKDAGIQYLGIPTGNNYNQIQESVKQIVLNKILK